MLGAMVGGDPGPAHKAPDRGTVDDRAAALLAHLPKFVLQARPDAALVDGVDPVIILGRLIRHLRRRNLNAGIVVGSVEASEFGDRPLHHRCDLSLVRDVTDHADRFPAGRLYLVDGLPQRMLADVRQGDGRTGASERPCRGQAHARGGSGDQGHLSFEVVSDAHEHLHKGPCPRRGAGKAMNPMRLDRRNDQLAAAGS